PRASLARFMAPTRCRWIGQQRPYRYMVHCTTSDLKFELVSELVNGRRGPPRAERIERRRHVACCRGGDARRPVRREPVVDPELDVGVVQVLVEEEIQPGLEVPAVGAVDVGLAGGELARSAAAPAAAEGLEEVVRYVGCD